MPLKRSSSALVPSPLPPALPTFASLMLHFLFVLHLGHLLCHDLSDSDDILSKARDLIRKANLMLYTFSDADPVVKSCLLQSYRLSLYGSALWKLSCPATQSRSLLRTYSDASGIFHAIATPEFYTLLLACPVSLTYVIISQAASLLSSALSCSSLIV